MKYTDRKRKEHVWGKKKGMMVEWKREEKQSRSGRKQEEKMGRKEQKEEE